MSISYKKRGFSRLIPALSYSIDGLIQAWHEPAFFLEICIAAFLIPAAFFVGGNWLEICFLIGLVFFVLVVEILNTSIESAIDRIGLQNHPLSRRSKDLGSAAVFLSLLLCTGVWVSALFNWVIARSFF